jgi:hypothetical protein
MGHPCTPAGEGAEIEVETMYSNLPSAGSLKGNPEEQPQILRLRLTRRARQTSLKMIAPVGEL